MKNVHLMKEILEVRVNETLHKCLFMDNFLQEFGQFFGEQDSMANFIDYCVGLFAYLFSV